MTSPTLQQQRFMTLYRAAHDKFYKYCAAMVCHKSMLPDLINETLLVAYSKFDELKDHQAFPSFLIGIFRNLDRNSARKRQPEPQPDEQLRLHDKQQVEFEPQYNDAQMLNYLLGQLTPEYREAIVLFEINGYKVEEIAEIQQTSVSNVKVRLMRARDKLKKMVAQSVLV